MAIVFECSYCNSEVEVNNLDDIVDCPSCSNEVRKETCRIVYDSDDEADAKADMRIGLMKTFTATFYYRNSNNTLMTGLKVFQAHSKKDAQITAKNYAKQLNYRLVTLQPDDITQLPDVINSKTITIL